MAGYFRGSRRSAGMAGVGGGDRLGGRVWDGGDFVDLHVAGHVVGAGGVCGRGEGEEQARDAYGDEGHDEETEVGAVSHCGSAGRTSTRERVRGGGRV